ncbi:hypothetical protein ACU4GD_32355 [Cupriavidus basilensis]
MVLVESSTVVGLVEQLDEKPGFVLGGCLVLNGEGVLRLVKVCLCPRQGAIAHGRLKAVQELPGALDDLGSRCRLRLPASAPPSAQ